MSRSAKPPMPHVDRGQISVATLLKAPVLSPPGVAEAVPPLTASMCPASRRSPPSLRRLLCRIYFTAPWAYTT